ncbi:hypothetical protein D3C79_796150 [compost metagenome]
MAIQLTVSCVHADHALAVDGITGIEDQIEQNHLQLPGIDFDIPQVLGKLYLKRHGIGQGLPEQRACRLNQRRHLDPARLQRLVAGKTEQLLGHLAAAFAGIEDMPEQALGTLWIPANERQPGRTDDDGQQVVEIMRHAPGQLAEGFELLRLTQLRAHLIELQRGLAPLGDVAGNFRQPHHFAIGRPDHVQHHQRPEQRAVLAQAPTFILGATGTQGAIEQPGRLAVGTILRGEEYREMLTDHFIGTVALDPLGTGVP